MLGSASFSSLFFNSNEGAVEKAVCETRCSWIVDGDKNLEHAVSISLQKSDTESSTPDDVDDMVSVDSCIHLVSPPEDPTDSPVLILTASPGHYLQRLSVLCEARFIEVFSSLEEYITTAKGEFVDKVEDFVVYKVTLNLPSATQMCSLKFRSLRSNTDMWLYGVHAVLGPFSTQPGHTPSPITSPTSKLDIDKIADRLHSSDTDLSSKATRMMSMVSSFQKIQQLQQTPQTTSNMLDLFKLLNIPKNLSTVPDSPTDVTERSIVNLNRNGIGGQGDCNSNFDVSSKIDRTTLIGQSEAGGGEGGVDVEFDGENAKDEKPKLGSRHCCSCTGISEDAVRRVVREAVEQMETRLTQLLESKMCELDSKQDRILDMLEKLTANSSM